MADALTNALALAKRGFAVFPLKAKNKTPPLVEEWQKRATTDPATIEKWWAVWPDANIAIHCRQLLVLDIDKKKGKSGFESLAKLQRQQGQLPETLTNCTPSGGEHRLFSLPAGHPGVSNSAGKLGVGLDVRGNAGYIVAPGSEVSGVRYRFAANVPIAPAPQWLLELCTTAAVKPSNAGPVPDAPAEVLERAREWLNAQPGAVQGQGGDARTFTVACGLRDFGVSADQAVELLDGWNGRCSPPWAPDELRIKVRNAFAYAGSPPGTKAVLPGDFPVVDPLAHLPGYAEAKDLLDRVRAEGWKLKPKGDGIVAMLEGDEKDPAFAARVEQIRTELPAATVRTVQSKFWRMSDIDVSEATRNDYIVKGFLQKKRFALLFGQPGEGKTFCALALGYAVASGKPFLGQIRVKRGSVLFLAYESPGSLKNREIAIAQQFGIDDNLIGAPADFNLKTEEGRKELGQMVADVVAETGPLSLIIIDTWARLLSRAGVDENDATEVGNIVRTLEMLVESSGASVLCIAHSGKDRSLGVRGSSALKAAISTELEVDNRTLYTRKQRDIEEHAPVGFDLTPVTIGVDGDGDAVTSCIVVPAAVQDQRERLRGNQKRAFGVLCDLSPGNAPVTESAWKDECDFLPEKSARQAWHDIASGLRRKGFVDFHDNGTVTRRMEGPE